MNDVISVRKILVGKTRCSHVISDICVFFLNKNGLFELE